MWYNVNFWKVGNTCISVGISLNLVILVNILPLTRQSIQDLKTKRKFCTFISWVKYFQSKLSCFDYKQKNSQGS